MTAAAGDTLSHVPKGGACLKPSRGETGACKFPRAAVCPIRNSQERVPQEVVGCRMSDAGASPDGKSFHPQMHRLHASPERATTRSVVSPSSHYLRKLGGNRI